MGKRGRQLSGPYTRTGCWDSMPSTLFREEVTMYRQGMCGADVAVYLWNSLSIMSNESSDRPLYARSLSPLLFGNCHCLLYWSIHNQYLYPASPKKFCRSHADLSCSDTRVFPVPFELRAQNVKRSRLGQPGFFLGKRFHKATKQVRERSEFWTYQCIQCFQFFPFLIIFV